MSRLQDKIALVAGGAAGIGLQAARLFLAEAAMVAPVDLQEADLKGAAADLDVPHGVRVNPVHPSRVTTRMMRSLEEGFDPGHGNDVKQQLATKIPLGRRGQSAAIANLVLFLAPDGSAFATGAQYPIDGGMVAG